MTAACLKNAITGKPLSSAVMVERLGPHYRGDVANYHQSVAFNTAARLIRFFHKKAIQLVYAIADQGLTFAYSPTGIPISFAVPVLIEENGAKVLYVDVFENIKILGEYCTYTRAPSEHCFSNICWYHNACLADFHRGIVRDLADPMKAKKWETPSRQIKQIKRRKRINIFKYLRELIPSKSNLSDSALQTIGEYITSEFLPIEIKWCKSPEDWQKMYEKAGSKGSATSCMVSTSQYAGGWKVWLKEGFHPAHWYHYHPEVEGAYIEKGGGVVARTVIISTGGKKYYTRVYNTNTAIGTLFKNTLEEHGVKSWNTHWGNDTHRVSETEGYATQATEFRVPGFQPKNSKHWFCPFPWLDWLANVWRVDYDKSTHEFIFKKIDDISKSNIKVKTHSGFIRDDMTTVQRCTYCNEVCPSDRMITSDDGLNFCSAGHAGRHGYLPMYTGENIQIFKKIDEHTYVDVVDATCKFTNMEAAIRCGALPNLDIYNIEENIDANLTVIGNEVYYDNKKVRVCFDQFDYIRRAHFLIVDNDTGKLNVVLPEKFRGFKPNKVQLVETLTLRYGPTKSEVMGG